MTSYHCATGCDECRPKPRDYEVASLIRAVHKLQSTPSRPDDYRAEVQRLIAEHKPDILMEALMVAISEMCPGCWGGLKGLLP